MPEVQPFATRSVALSALALALVLLVFSNSYGYHRDELYFRMLAPAWGYVDEPPLTPLLAHFISRWIADTVWAVRAPAVFCATISVAVIALIAREVGGGKFAQTLAAWGYAFGAFTLSFGHVFLTASIDLLVWPTVALLVVRAMLRQEQKWWILAGAVVGIGSYNKLLLALLLGSLTIGLLVAGRRQAQWIKGLCLLGTVALILGAPNLIYQVSNGFPQLSMAAALSAKHAGTDRVMIWPMLLLMIGPCLAPFWIAALWSMVRRADSVDLRFIAVSFAALVLLVFVSGGQPYYVYGLLSVVFAVGCRTVEQYAVTRYRQGVAIAAVAINAITSLIVALPVLPLPLLHWTPIPLINSAIADQVGWPEFVDEIENVAATLPQKEPALILTSNYGEAGALSRFGRADLPPIYSGHNQLGQFGPPPEYIDRTVVVGGVLRVVQPLFQSCRIVTKLDDLVDISNEEQGKPVAVCEGRRQPWEVIWPLVKHLD